MNDENSFSELSQKLVEELESIGIYAMGPLNFSATPASGFEDVEIDPSSEGFQELVNSGVAEVHINGVFRVGDVALSDRVLDPESHQTKVQFDSVLPTAIEEARELSNEDPLDGLDDEDD